MYRGQMSPMLARRLTQWHDGEAKTGIPRGIALTLGADVLPPELLKNLENLRPPLTPPPPEETLNIADASKYGYCNNFVINVGLASVRVLPAPTTRRNFLFMVNTHATQVLFLRFAGDSNALIGVPIAAAGGFIGFDTFVPQDDVYLIGNGAATTGVGLFSNQ